MKDTFANRVARAVSESGLTVRQIAELAKTSPGQVSQWQTEGKVQPENIKADVLEKMSVTLGVRSRWLLYGEEPMRDVGASPSLVSAPATPPGYIRFHLLDGVASGGYGAVNEDFPEVVQELDLAEWQVRKQLGFIPETGRVALITVRGDSMYPDINNGDVMMVDTRLTHFDGDGVYLINLHGQTLVKRLQMMRDGLHVKSTNKKYDSFVVPPGELDTLYVCGRIAGAALMRSGSEL